MTERILTPKEREELHDRLAEYLSASTEPFVLDGPIMTTVKKRDGTFGKRSLGADPFYFSSIYISPAERVILVFEPEDPNPEYATIEVKLTEADKFFPMLGAEIARFCTDVLLDGRPKDDLIFSVIEGTEDIVRLVEVAYSLEAERLQVEEEDEQKALIANPSFGIF